LEPERFVFLDQLRLGGEIVEEAGERRPWGAGCPLKGIKRHGHRFADVLEVTQPRIRKQEGDGQQCEKGEAGEGAGAAPEEWRRGMFHRV